MIGTIVVCTFEQRHTERTAVSWPVSIWHPKATRFFNGQSINVSSDGALIVLPMKVPVREGQNLELNFPRSETLARLKGRFARIKKARVIRIDRRDASRQATIKVGLEFNNQSETYDELT